MADMTNYWVGRYEELHQRSMKVWREREIATTEKHRAALRQARTDALEEAAKVCDVNAEKEYPLGEGFRNLDASELAAAIRSLKDKA